MCLLIYKNSGIKLDPDKYRNAFNDNGDGGGVAFVKDGKLVVNKGWFKFKSLLKYIQANEELEMIIHFRRASPGMAVSSQMCHPFLVESGSFKDDKGQPLYRFAIAHNGKLSYRDTKEKSDTACFVEDVLGPQLDRDPWFLDNPSGVWFMEKALGLNNKMAVMKHDVAKNKTTTYILNEAEGWGGKQAHWKDKVWYSNYSYEPPIVVKKPDTSPNEIYQSYLKGMSSSVNGNEWTTPDKNGWKWSFNLDKWVNKETGVVAETLVGREPPAYMKMRQKGIAGTFPPTPSEDRQPTSGDVDMMDDAAWQRWAETQDIGRVIDLKTGKTVEGKDRSLLHLTVRERMLLRRAAHDHFKRMTEGAKGDGNVVSLTMAEKVAYLRSDVRELITECKEIGDEALDKWITMVQDSDKKLQIRLDIADAGPTT